MGEANMNKVVVIGSGVAARSLLQVLKQEFKDDFSVTVIRKDEDQIVPCAIPYIFKKLMPDKIRIEDSNWSELGAQLIEDEAVDIDRENKEVILQNSSSVKYDRLIIASGAKPVKPPITGIDLENVIFVEKNLDLLQNIYKRVLESKKIAIIGGGFIGVEIADELSSLDNPPEINLIEAENKLLPVAFDEEFSREVEKELENKGVNLHKGDLVKEINGSDQAEGLTLSSGNNIEADMVICAIGVVPNAKIAEKAGLALGGDGGILTDDYYYTSDPDILACGDCRSKRNAIVGGPSAVRLASTAASESKTAVYNLFSKRLPGRGAINLFGSKVGSTTVGAAGITEEGALKHGLEYIVVSGTFANRHPAKFEDVENEYIKLIFSKPEGNILGGQAMGSNSIIELINATGLAIQNGASAFELTSNQYATHPLLTTGPSGYPLLKLSTEASIKLAAN